MQRQESEMLTGPAYSDDYKHAPKGQTIEDELAAIRGVSETVENHKAAPVLGSKSKGLRRFRSDSPKFRLQMKTTPPKVTPEGYWLEGESRFIQFKPYTPGGGIFETEDPDEIRVMEACTAYGVTIYDVDAMATQAEQARLDFVENMISKDQKLFDRLKSKFGKEDFVDDGEFGAPKNGKGAKKGK